MKSTHYFYLLLIGTLTLGSTACYSQEDPVARVMEVLGSATVVRSDGSREALERRDSIYPGDSIETANNGVVQLRFSDSSLTALRCESRLRVHSYQYRQSAGDHVTLELHYGGMRALISRPNYRLETPAAVIIGDDADFEVAIAADGAQYFGVYDGAITIQGAGEEARLGRRADADFGKLEPGLAIEELTVLPSLLGHSILILPTNANVRRSTGCSP